MIVRKKKPSQITFRIFNTIVMVMIILACIVPVWHVICASFSNPAWVIQQTGLIYKIHGFTLGGYKLVFQNKSILTGYLNSIIYVSINTGLNILFTIMLAYPVARGRTLWGNSIMLFITITMLFNGGLIANYFVVTKILKMYNTRVVMIIPGCLNAFSLILVRASMIMVPDSLEESAKLDGAGRVQILFQIIVPLIKPVIATIALFSIVGGWNAWFSASIYLKSRALYPLQLVLKEILVNNDLSSSMTTVRGVQSADTVLYKELIKYCAIVVSIVPMLMAYPFVQKYFEKGIMLGAVKG